MFMGQIMNVGTDDLTKVKFVGQIVDMGTHELKLSLSARVLIVEFIPLVGKLFPYMNFSS
jgi:hypothetical protein